MKRFKNILLAVSPKTDGTAAITQAVQLANSNRARLTIADVDQVTTEERLLNHLALQRHLQQVLREEGRKHIKSLELPSKRAQTRLKFKVLTGVPFIQIIREVLRERHDLLITTAERPGGLRDRLFGSTSLHLMRKCPCPVWVMKPTRRKRFRRIMAALDPDPTNEARTALSTTIMELATSLAKLEGSELRVFHSVEALEVPLLEQLLVKKRGQISKRDLKKCTETALKKEKSHFQGFLKRFDLRGMQHKIHFVEGHAASLIPKHAANARVELIVMGSVNRTGMPGFLIGSTAEEVLDQVNCSVLTVKPTGFVSPVSL